MTVFRNSALLLSLGFAVSACGGAGGGTANRGMESVNQPVVARADYAFDVTAGGPLSAQEASRLTGWFDALQLGYGDRISIDLPDSYGDNGTRESVAAIAARYGLLVQDQAPVTSGQVPHGMARVIVSRLKASVPNCPNWATPSSNTFSNETHSNFGCAVNSNLAAMIADPEDLVRGQPGGTVVDTASSGRAIRSYRNAKPTGEGGLRREDARGGGGQ
jgi:pilus assembly protein CpaD